MIGFSLKWGWNCKIKNAIRHNTVKTILLFIYENSSKFCPNFELKRRVCRSFVCVLSNGSSFHNGCIFSAYDTIENIFIEKYRDYTKITHQSGK